MKKFIPSLIFFIVALTYLIYYIIYVIKYKKGISNYVRIKNYKKNNSLNRVYEIDIDKNILYVKSNRFYMIGQKIKVSKYKNKYYIEIVLKEIVYKLLLFLSISILLFIISII